MSYLNVNQRVLETKVVYYGAGLSGKTTNLEQIRKRSSGGRAGELMSLNTDGDRTLFFDWLPFDLGKIRGCDVKIQLYTVPGQPQYVETRKRVLRDADGIVLVLDSESGAIDRNRTIVNEMRHHIEEFGLEGVPIVVQMNKRDLPTAMSVDALQREFDLAELPCIEAVAFEGRGVFETLKQIGKQVVIHVQSELRAGATIAKGEASGLDGHTMYEGLTSSSVAAASGTPTNRPSATRAASSPPKRPEIHVVSNESSTDDTEASGNGVPVEALNRLEACLTRLEASEARSVSARIDEAVGSTREIGRKVSSAERATQKAIEASKRETVAALTSLRNMLDPVPEQLDGVATKVEARLDSVVSEITTILASNETVEALFGVDHRIGELAKQIGAHARTQREELLERLDRLRDDLSGEGATSVAETMGELSRRVDALESRIPRDLGALLADIRLEVGGLDTSIQSQVEAALDRRFEVERKRHGSADGPLAKSLQAIGADVAWCKKMLSQIGQGQTGLSSSLTAARNELKGAMVEQARGTVEHLKTAFQQIDRQLMMLHNASSDAATGHAETLLAAVSSGTRQTQELSVTTQRLGGDIGKLLDMFNQLPKRWWRSS